MAELSIWLLAMLALPLAVAGAASSKLELERLRRLSVVCAIVLIVLAAMPMFVSDLAHVALAWPGSLDATSPIGRLLGPSIVRSDALSELLLPLLAALWLICCAVTPRSRLDRAGLRRTAIAVAMVSLAFASQSPIVLAICWIGSLVLYLRALTAPEHRRARRVASIYLGASMVLFAVGVVLSFGFAPGSLAQRIGTLLLLSAALIRKGIFPFHAWVPEVFERGRLGPAVLLSTPQLGAYATAVLIVPQAAPETLRVVAILALVTAVYGAALALIQRDARRALGYLFVSQSALVMAGLDGTSERALAGSLTLWISSALAFAGVACCVLVLEARRGRLDLSQFHGGYSQMPLLAIGFVVLGLACTGFPGTLGFIGQEMLVSGATDTFPVLGFCVVAAGALTGLAVLRMYFSLFCGRSDAGPQLHSLRHERIVFGGLAALLIAAGLVPGPLVGSRIAAAERMVETGAGASF